MTDESNEIKILNEGCKTFPKRRKPVVMSEKIIIKPWHQEILHTKVNIRKDLEGHTRMKIPDEHLENCTNLRLSSSVVAVRKDKIFSILAINLIDHAIPFTKNKHVAVFQLLFPQEVEEIIEFGPQLLALDKLKDGDVFREDNQHMRVGEARRKGEPKHSPPEFGT